MSVVIMTRFDIDGSTVDDLMAKHSETLKRVSEIGRSSGALHHQFIQDPDGTLFALDEWESEDAYHRFFDGQDDIKAVMADAKLAGPPVSTTYREVEAQDRF